MQVKFYTVTTRIPGYLGQGHATKKLIQLLPPTLPPGVKNKANSMPAESPPPCTS